MRRQVMECARDSAAFPLAPAGFSSNLYTNLARSTGDANDSKNFVSHTPPAATDALRLKKRPPTGKLCP